MSAASEQAEYNKPCPNDPDGRHNHRGPHICGLCGAVDINGMTAYIENLEQRVSTIDSKNRKQRHVIDVLIAGMTGE